jgi:hypothetical protein
MLSKYFFRLVPVQVAVDVPRQIGAQPLKQQQLMDIVFLVTTRQQDWLVVFHDQHSQNCSHLENGFWEYIQWFGLCYRGEIM